MGASEITSVAELEDLLGQPLPWVAAKGRRSLHAIDVEWIAHSPMLVIATSAADGTCDVSPKGDPPGFARVLDATRWRSRSDLATSAPTASVTSSSTRTSA